MTKISCFVLSCLMWLTITPCVEADVVLVRNGQTRARIILSHSASESEQWAARDLADHLKQISGANMDIVTGGDRISPTAIILGDGQAARSLGVTMNADELGPDGYVIKIVGDRLVIAGGRRRGTMYGVYTLLESLGCRWWYPGASTIPNLSTISIPDMDVTDVPALEYRDFLYGDMDDSEAAQLWRARNKINGGFYKQMPSRYGGAYTFMQLVHSYGRLAPPQKYFADHPEYFALKRGTRVNSQPCFSSEGMVKVMADAILRERMTHPEYRHFTIGQNDNNNYCECDACQQLAEQYGLSGMQIDFAERIAKHVRATYPDMRINVPAYSWSRQPPLGGKVPDKRMSITLCSIECNFGQPLVAGTPEVNAAFKRDIEGWSAIADQLLIWNYTTNFKHFELPYPNYYSLVPNVKFYVENHVKGIMHQGTHTSPFGQFAPLNMWILSKAMWNPDQDGRKLVAEFMHGFYGPAGEQVLAYANALDAAKEALHRPLFCRWSKATYLHDAYLSPALVETAERLFIAARSAVENDAELLHRVNIAHLPIQYLVAKRPQLWPAVKRARPNVNWKTYCETLVATGQQAGIIQVAERDSARFFYEWLLDYGAQKKHNWQADLPIELKHADPTTFRFVQAAQFTGQMRFLQKSSGATDGWAQKVISHGWSIQHRLGPPYDYIPGKRYTLYVRVRAIATDPTRDGLALQTGFYVKGSPGARGGLTMAAADGTWKTLNCGEFTAPAEGGSFFVCLDSKTKALVRNAEIDALWIRVVE
jgi:hypothetical protein